MICQNCGAEVGPEEANCPKCNAENPFATQHRQNKKRFQKAYNNTKGRVIDSAQKTKGLATRAAILAVLIIGILIAAAVTRHEYEGPDPDKAARREAERHPDEYAKEAEQLLESRAYMEYVSFLYAHELQNFPPEQFEPLKKVTYVAMDYYECIKLMEQIVLRSDDPEYFDGLDTDIRNLGMYLESFFQVVKVQKEAEKNEAYLACMEDMEALLKAAMRTYFAMDEQQLEEFLSLSEVQKSVKLEEVFRHEQ
ncbi:MAG: hypothetical protein K6E18_09205 [Lachnospiraceae bacterium]|nr:hypothetical protein [Lachnospiraceae bacterium]